MIGGFGVIAWPVNYGETGVMTFIVSQSGEVYEQDLGPETPQTRRGHHAVRPGQGLAEGGHDAAVTRGRDMIGARVLAIAMAVCLVGACDRPLTTPRKARSSARRPAPASDW